MNMRKTTKTKARTNRKKATKKRVAATRWSTHYHRTTDYCRLMIGVLHDDWSDADLDEANRLIHEALSATDYHVWTEHDCLMQPYDSDADQLPCVAVILKPRNVYEAIDLAVGAISPLVVERCDLAGRDDQDREVIQVHVQRGLEWSLYAPLSVR